MANTVKKLADTVKVELGLKRHTVNLITDLTKKTSAINEADTISSSVELVAELLEELKNGAELFLKKRDGSIQKITITGLTK